MAIKTISFFTMMFFFAAAPFTYAAEIHDAAQNGDLVKIKSLIENDPTLVNATDNRNCTPLHFAANGGHLEIMKFLIEQGAHVDVRDVDGDTPLHWAAFAGHKDAVALLIDHGMDINAQNKGKRAPLDWAVIRGHKDIVNLLLEKGVQLNSQGEQGINLLHNAAVFGHQKLVELLLAQGVDIHTRNNQGGNMVHSAAAGNVFTIVKKMLDAGIKINDRDYYGNTALHKAATSGHFEAARILVENGAPINSQSKDGKTALHYAQLAGSRDIVDLLLQKNADNTPWKFPVLKGSFLGQKKPGLTPELFAPGIVSTPDNNERDVTFSPDLKEFYFTQYSRTQRMGIRVMKEKNSGWTEPETVSFSGQCPEAEAFVTADGQKLYFISRRPQQGANTAGPWDIWCTHRNGDDWDEPQQVSPLFKGGFYPTITLNGTFYYTTAGNDLYRSKLINGNYQTVESLGDSINTAVGEYNAFVPADESFIIFTSFGWGNHFGGGDLYISFHKNDDTWTTPKNMGAAINTEAHEYCPSMSPDRKYFFFTSNKNGNEDIYWVDSKIIDTLR